MTATAAAAGHGRSPVFLRFLACGGIAAAANFGSRFGWSLVLPFEAAVVAAYATGMAVAFLLFRRFVFPEGRQPVRAQARDFVLVNLIGMAATTAVAAILVRLLDPLLGAWAESVAHLAAIATPVATSWVGHRRLTFR